MGRTFNGTSQILLVTGGTATFPLSLCWRCFISDPAGRAIGPAMHGYLSETSGNVICIEYVGSGVSSGIGFRAFANAPNATSPSSRHVGTDVSVGWHHVSCSWSAITVAPKLYVDGVSITGTSSSGSGGNPFTITNINISSYVEDLIRVYGSGSASDCAIISAELSDSEHRQFAAGCPANMLRPSALYGYWLPRRDTFGSSDRDYSGRGRNMSASGGPTWSDDPPQTKRRRVRRVGAVAISTKYWTFARQAVRIIGGGIGT